MKSLFISPQAFLKPSGGGVQWCTREFLQSLKNADLKPEILAYETPKKPWIRLLRKTIPIPFYGMVPSQFKKKTLRLATKQKPKYIFLNNNEAASIAPYLRENGYDGKIIFLSHGVEITDVVNNLRLAPLCLPAMYQRPIWLGNLLKSEIRIRSALDGVFCVSETDLLFEQWLGSKKSIFLPRQIEKDKIKRAIISNRVGLVATLNHGPNLHGLEMLGKELAKQNKIELRLVGSPVSDGKRLANKYRKITFLGPLSDQEAKEEAASWSAFINPIFCYARGVSTKVATALGWGLPVLTTPMGSRGYRWDEKGLPLCPTPQDLMIKIVQISNKKNNKVAVNATKKIVGMAPKPAEITGLIRKFLQEI